LFDFHKKIKVLSVAFMPMHLGASCVQKVFKTRFGVGQISLRIFQVLWKLFSSLESLIYLLDGYIIFSGPPDILFGFIVS
jgi:hypothetical protein